MFKNLTIYTANPVLIATSFHEIEEAVYKVPFAECGATQEMSYGWVPPRREEHGALAENVGGQWILRFMTEKRVISGATMTKKLKEKAEHFEQQNGYKPGRKMMRELKDEAKLDLLPTAQLRQKATYVWIDRMKSMIVIDTATQSVADQIISLLVEALKGLSVSLLDTQTSPQAAMAFWLKEQEGPSGFSIDRECELRGADEAKAVVRYKNHPLDVDEVVEHVEHGLMPVSLAITWDDRVSFVLTDGLKLKKVRILDAVLESAGEDRGDFDADVAIATGELRKLIPDMIEALGGEGRQGHGDCEPGALARATAQRLRHERDDEDDDPAAGL